VIDRAFDDGRFPLDSSAGRSYDRRMPVWRCPHCGTPQAETSRCWVCRRSTTSCATCRHFRRGIAGGLGLCGLDPRRTALRGTEMRACWAASESDEHAAQTIATPVATSAAPGALDAAGRRPRTFVPVEELDVATEPVREPAPARVAAPAAGGGGWSLWGDAEA
jgi:hypothetical protein